MWPRNQTTYEFDWELMSKDGDIEDHDHFFSFNNKTTLARAKYEGLEASIDLNSLTAWGESKKKNEDGSYDQFVVVKDVWDADGYNEYRTWAYLNENNELDEFDDGSKVPQFVHKFFNFATY
tara:strand:+ start:297 stop:662 length:366 start_codon:yes stop_codon:yes gene_type:complete